VQSDKCLPTFGRNILTMSSRWTIVSACLISCRVYTLKKEAPYYSEMSVKLYKTGRYHALDVIAFHGNEPSGSIKGERIYVLPERLSASQERLCSVELFCRQEHTILCTVSENSMKNSIFWDITPCIPLKFNRCFGGKYRLHLQGRRISQARNKEEAVSNCMPSAT
jgi:hypothetical protein